MYLMYVDESGDTGLGPAAPTRFFVLSGVVVHELRWKPFVDELVAFRRDLKTRFGLKLREEIHAAHFLTRPGEVVRIPKHQRLEILRLYADFLAGFPDIAVINVVVDKGNKAPGYQVFENAWQALIQRFENTISHRNFPGPKHPDERGMLFPDATDQKKLNALMRRMRVYNPVSNQPAYGPGYRNIQLRSVIEDANFRDSATSFLIQSADLCAFLLYQHLTPMKYMRKKSGQNYFKRLDPILCKQAATRDPDGIVRL
jgi:hypothetical protein